MNHGSRQNMNVEAFTGLMLGGLFGSVCSIDITFDAEQNRKTAALGEASGGNRLVTRDDW